MRVGILTASLGNGAGGVGVVVRSLADALSIKSGFAVQLYGEGAQDTTNLRPFGVTGPAAFGYIAGLHLALKADRLDLLHTHGLWMYPSVACLRWKAQARGPYLVSPHGMLDGWALRNSRWKKRIAGSLYEDRHLDRKSTRLNSSHLGISYA